jgi:hypothetical protein
MRRFLSVWGMIRTMRISAVVVVFLLAACSGGESLDSPEAVAGKLGCADTFSDTSTDELGVEAVGECRVSGETVRILMFASDDARDGFVEVAQGFGSRYVTGDGFAVEVNSAPAEQAVKDAL